MKIIDAHTHIFPEKIVERATKSTAEFYSGGKTEIKLAPGEIPKHTGTADDLDRQLKKAGIDSCVVFSAATAARQVESINSFIASECEAHQNWYGVGTMHAEFENFESECDRMLSMNLRGIKLHPDIQRFRIDDERLYPLYEIMSDRHMFLITHAGDSRFDYSGPKRIAGVAKMFPKLKIIGAHFAGWSEWDEAMKYLNLENIYMDTSSTYAFTGRDTILRAFDTYDNTHIFFGSDYPMWDPEHELETIMSLGLRTDVLEGVLHRNFEVFMQNL